MNGLTQSFVKISVREIVLRQKILTEKRK